MTMWQTAGMTVLAIVVLALGAATWRLARRERQRSAARVAALGAAMDEADWTPDSTHFGAPPESLAAFAPEADSPFRKRILVGGGFAIVLLATLLLIGIGSDGRLPSRDPAAESSHAAIELLSMRHTRDADALIVSGLVRNPARLPTPALAVVISTLDRDGRIVARGQSPLDPVVLAPGKETSFRVTVSHADGVGRYRVGFVAGAHAVPHVDRRPDPARTVLTNN
jgi:hypothetical protein